MNVTRSSPITWASTPNWSASTSSGRPFGIGLQDRQHLREARDALDEDRCLHSPTSSFSSATSSRRNDSGATTCTRVASP